MRTLKNLTQEERSKLFPIILKPYNKDWPSWYKTMETALIKQLKGSIKRINHIGSTSVTGLTAKPTIDILVEIEPSLTIESLLKLLEPLTLIYNARQPLQTPFLLTKGYTVDGFEDKVYHIHIREYADQNELYFRDFLRSNPQTQKEYTKLKQELAEAYEYNRENYTDAKTNFIESVTNKAKQLYKNRYVPK